MLTLERDWFADATRRKISETLEKEAASRLMFLTSYELPNQDDADFVHRTNRVLGELTVLTTLSYILVNPTQKRPWLVRKTLPKVLDLEETLTYIDELKDWLIKTPPSPNRGLLVQTQTILKNLTEINYE